MLARIRQFFDKQMKPGAGTQVAHRLQVATAALLVEMMRMDQDVKEVEHRRVMGAIQTKFGITPEETAELMRLAEAEAKNATDYYQFTSLINREFTAEQKQRVIDYLWDVAYADGHLDQYEEHLVRKIADLLYIPHQTFIAAKLRAREAS